MAGGLFDWMRCVRLFNPFMATDNYKSIITGHHDNQDHRRID